MVAAAIAAARAGGAAWADYARSVVPPAMDGLAFRRLMVVTDYSDIWAAEDTRLGRPVAVKVFSPKADAGSEVVGAFPVAEWRRRFVAEARLMAAIEHPNIVPVHALTRLPDGRPAMVQQLMAGSLRLEIGRDHTEAGQPEGDRPRAVAPERARAILEDVIAALRALHERGIVHRDVKPLNLLLAGGPGGRVKLCDFGMARQPDEAAIDARIWFGTPDYMAPEQQANATRVTDRADVYSLGILAYRLLTGRLPGKSGSGDDLPEPFALFHSATTGRDPALRPSAREAAALLAR